MNRRSFLKALVCGVALATSQLRLGNVIDEIKRTRAYMVFTYDSGAHRAGSVRVEPISDIRFNADEQANEYCIEPKTTLETWGDTKVEVIDEEGSYVAGKGCRWGGVETAQQLALVEGDSLRVTYAIGVEGGPISEQGTAGLPHWLDGVTKDG